MRWTWDNACRIISAVLALTWSTQFIYAGHAYWRKYKESVGDIHARRGAMILWTVAAYILVSASRLLWNVFVADEDCAMPPMTWLLPGILAFGIAIMLPLLDKHNTSLYGRREI